MGKANYRQIPSLLGRLEEFEGNSMRGERFDCKEGRHINSGRLYPSDRARLDAARVRYVVFSYATPIAWVTEDYEIVIPDTKYSTTTSRQQTLCRAWLGLSLGDGLRAIKR